MTPNEELDYLQGVKNSPFDYLIDQTKLVLEEELKLLETGNNKLALISLRNQKMKDVEKLNAKIEALEVKQ